VGINKKMAKSIKREGESIKRLEQWRGEWGVDKKRPESIKKWRNR